MMPYGDSRLTRIILVTFFVLLVGYTFYEIRGLMWGPVIEIENRVLEVSDRFIAIEGFARRIATLSMNGKIIPVTEEGAFSEGYVLTPGYNRVVLEARDRYGNSTERSIELVFTPEANSNNMSTSTPSQELP